MQTRDGEPDLAYNEQQEVATKDLPKMIEAGLLKEVEGETGTVTAFSGTTPKATVALVYDYYSGWVCLFSSVPASALADHNF